MKRSFRRKSVLSATASLVLIAGITCGLQLYVGCAGYSLPYRAGFLPNAEDRWTAFGGIWEVVEGSMRNDSNDRGAKLLTGSPKWKNYVVEGDTELLGSGSAGVLGRVSEAELGEDSFKGYLAGVRTGDNNLVLGAYDFIYHEAAKVPMPDPVRPFRWYHVKLILDGCNITAAVSAVGMREIRTTTVNDPGCFRSGGIGLRSNGTGGVWRNIRVARVDSAATTPYSSTQEVRPRDAFAFRMVQPQTGAQRDNKQPPGGEPSAISIQPVRSLQYLAPFGSPLASVRGSVVLIRPAVYVEDSTGGVEIQSDSPMPLKIGDEVEVTGEVNLDKLNPVIRHARFRPLREAVPLSPAVLTANQVATGFYDGQTVQVEGILRTISAEKDGTITMVLDAGTQSFRAILPAGRSWSHVRHLAIESQLRLRGVAVVAARFNKAADPFVVLVRSAEDVDVAAGPPRWRPSTLIYASLVGLCLIFIGNHFYLRVKHWRLHAVAEERERLAHEIHDTLAQSFAGIGFQLQAIRNSMPPDAAALERQVDLAMLMTRTSHEEARRSIASLHRQSLGSRGLLPALRECAERMVRNGNVIVETYGDVHGRSLPPHIKDTLYRIGQEAVANSIRHAAPNTILIRLDRQGASVCLSIEDDGKGFSAESDCAGFGLPGMRKKAESISARLMITSNPGSGTRVEVKAAVVSRFQIVARPRRSFNT